MITRSEADLEQSDEALTVYYRLSGDAVNGVDYMMLPGSMTIPAGASFATVIVTPIDDNIFRGTRSVTLNILYGTGYGYSAALPVNATVFIKDNDPPPATETLWVNDTVPAGAWTGADQLRP